MLLWDADVVFAKTFELAVCKSMKINQRKKSKLQGITKIQEQPYRCSQIRITATINYVMQYFRCFFPLAIKNLVTFS